MQQKEVAGKILLELIESGIINENDQEIVHLYLRAAYASGWIEGKYQRGKRRSILQSDMNGKPIVVHMSIKEAANKLHLDVATIGRALRGVLQSAGGFKWSYADVKNYDGSTDKRAGH